MKRDRGFTLLEVLVALVILGVAIVTLIQLAAQGIRLLALSGDHQQAGTLGDRLMREPVVLAEGAEIGHETIFTWERRVVLVPVEDELISASDRAPRLLALSVVVRWGQTHSLELASLRASPPPTRTSR